MIPKHYYAPLSDKERKLIPGFITQAQELHAVSLRVDLGSQVRNSGGIGEELSRALVRKRSRAGVDVFERDERRAGRRIVDREEILVLVVGVFLNICNTVGGRLGFLVFVWVEPRAALGSLGDDGGHDNNWFDETNPTGSSAGGVSRTVYILPYMDIVNEDTIERGLCAPSR